MRCFSLDKAFESMAIRWGIKVGLYGPFWSKNRRTFTIFNMIKKKKKLPFTNKTIFLW